MILTRTLFNGALVFALAALPAAVSVADEEKEDGEKVVLEFELPEPFFGGTPLDYWGPNLEPESYKDREPYEAPAGTELVSREKTVTSSFPSPNVGRLEQVTDGDKDYTKLSLVELGEGVQWVQVDLEESKDIYAVLVWHFHEGTRVYFDVIVQVSNDPEFKEDVTTIYNNDHDNSAGLGVGEDKEYIEKFEGRLIPVDGVNARYVRSYTNGNTDNDFNHIVELEVWGK